MRLALLTDLHANRDAVEACLGKLRRAGYDRMVILGDIVGYGADPEWTVDTVRTLVADGAVAVYGNHDEAVLHTPPATQGGNGATQKHAHAQAAIDWTRDRLDDDQRAFLAALPLQQVDGDRLYVHANAWAPAQWGYISNALAAAQSIAATPQRVTFCGHVHAPALYHSQTGGGARAFLPTPGVGVPLVASRRWVVLPGSCGQPRDGNPAACCALYDTTTHTYTQLRVPYDHDAAARRVVEAGLPASLAQRLIEGR
jgi:diadenosine tetraphosphatase ApaH/serine/threonine PP2A family protein phosphatase